MAEKQVVEKPTIAKLPITLQLGDKLIDGAVIKSLSFAAYCDAVTEAQGMREPKSFEARIRRIRMTKQVDYYVNGSTVSVSQADVLKLPIANARLIISKLDEGEGKAGKVIRPGDGIEKAIIYELGNPIPMTGKPSISELEFMARTYGDVEDVLAAPDMLQQTATLISTLAKPLGTSLTVLPSWAVSQISIADGVTIAREVLPHFLGLPPE